MKIAALCCAILLLAPASGSADEKLHMWVSPLVAAQPAVVFVRTFVERNVDNRAIRIVVDSEHIYYSSEVTLDGDRAPVIKETMFRDLPAGSYTVSVELFGPQGKQRAFTSCAVLIN